MPRPDKRSSLTVLTNDRLRELAEGFELSPKSGMRHDELVELLAGSRRASFETVLGVLKRAELKEICRRHGLDDGGKAKEEIVTRLLGGGGRGSAGPGGQIALAFEGEVENEANAEGFKSTKKPSRKGKRGEGSAEIVAPAALASDTPTDATEAATLASMSTNFAVGQGSMVYGVPPSLTGAGPGGRGGGSDGSPSSVSLVPESTPALPEGVGVAPKTAKKKRRSANVPGQFYGYSLQITRVVAHFLRAHQGQSVSLEHLDDVATHTDEGIIAEQDKSGFKQNPVSDRSVELWKSLANWVRAIRDGALKSDTKFRLYVAQGHHGHVIDRIHTATTKAGADALVQSLRSEFWGDQPKYAARAQLAEGLAEHVNEVLAASDDVLARLFLNLSLENGSGAPNDDLGALPGMVAISQNKKDDVLKFLLGWAKKLIDKRIESGRAVVITWDEFHTAFLAAARKFDRAENVLFATLVDVTEAELQKELRDRTYVRQLQIVHCDDNDMVQAVHDYLRSATHRTNWSEDGDVIESSFDEFEGSLDRAWKSQKMVVGIEHKSLDDEERGRLLYAKCQQLRMLLQGMEVPDFFVPGSFHTMADSLRVGWHPRYREAIAALVTGLPANAQDETSTAPATEPARKRRPSTAPPAAAAGGGFVNEGGGA